ncbi:MAG: DUF192 domain-containing protein, partial [Polyangiaceae bacterium]|nr:DUF192 domain-containing protein [Polyangiaceae bacterium]
PTTPPPSATAVEECPKDPQGRPTMPRGRLHVVGENQAPALDVELALSNEHHRHGLMFRPELTDDQGMLFLFRNQEIRSFWMRNTCLALDMIFIDSQGVIVGIVEEVPPMNEKSRSVPCPANAVLEVPAGWSRRYGVRPGQQIQVQKNNAP